MIIDDTNCQIKVNLWDEEAEREDLKKNNIICLKNAIVSEYNSIKNIITGFKTKI